MLFRSPETGGGSVLTVVANLMRSGGQGETARDWAVARAVLPTAALPPGRYVAHAEVMSAGHLVARMARPFSIPD